VISVTVGFSTEDGKETLSTSDLMSDITSLLLYQVFTSTTVFETQTEDVEVIFFIPSISFICFSILSVIRVSISIGLTH
jgi:hypothetical protein